MGKEIIRIDGDKAVFVCKLNKDAARVEVQAMWCDLEEHDPKEPFVLTYDEVEKLYHALFKIRKAGRRK